METPKRTIEPGTPQPNEKYKIDIMPRGPYLVYGNPPLQQKILTPNKEQIPWTYTDGKTYPTNHEPTALCRCGHSQNHPYCDGSHAHAEWDSTLTADNTPLLENAESYDGPIVRLEDNLKYCVHARICMAKKSVWKLTFRSNDPKARHAAIHESTLCPSGRLKLWDKQKEAFIEPPFRPALGLIEDSQEKCSGPLWVQGGIPINGPEGILYEQRNRVTLCRCGSSLNKPFCDGSHLKTGFNDRLPLKKMGVEESPS